MRAAELIRLDAVALVAPAADGSVRVLAAHGPVDDDAALEDSVELIRRAGTTGEQAEVGSDPPSTVAVARLDSGAVVWGRRTAEGPLLDRELALLRELGEGADAARRRGPAAAAPGAASAGAPEAYLARAAALARDGVIGLDGTGAIVVINPAAAELFGISPDEAVGRPGEALLSHPGPDSSPLASATSDGVPHLVEAVRADGSTFWAEICSGSMTLPDGGVGRIVTVRDVTDQRRRDEEREKLLRIEREQRFMAELSHMRAEFVSEVTSRLNTSFAEPEALLRHLPDLTIPVIADYAICYPLTDTGPDDGPYVAGAAGEEDDDSPPAPPPLPELDWSERPRGRVIRSREEAPDELRDFFDAHARDLGARSLALLPIVEEERVPGVLLLSRTSELPEAQIRSDMELGRQLTQRAALVLANARLYREAKAAAHVRDQVLAVVSHDLRNPLNVIALTTDAFLRHWPSSPREMELARNQVGVMKRAAERAKRLVRDLLDVAQIEKGSLAVQPMRSDTGALLREAYQLHHALAERNAIALELDLPAELPPVEVDAERILQVLGNLIDNALRHTSPETTVRLAALSDGDRVRIEVRDEGPGIAPEDEDRLFDRFSRGRRGTQMGAGLGLAIARGIVDAHRGTLGFHNNDDAGATFYFTLPIAH